MGHAGRTVGDRYRHRLRGQLADDGRTLDEYLKGAAAEVVPFPHWRAHWRAPPVAWLNHAAHGRIARDFLNRVHKFDSCRGHPSLSKSVDGTSRKSAVLTTSPGRPAWNQGVPFEGEGVVVSVMVISLPSVAVLPGLYADPVTPRARSARGRGHSHGACGRWSSPPVARPSPLAAEPLRLENPTTIVPGDRVTHLVYDVCTG